MFRPACVMTFILILILGLLPGGLNATEPPAVKVTRVQIDASASPEHAAWAESTEKLANEWYPRLGNLLASEPSVVLPTVRVRIDPTYDGVAAASGAEIRISSQWVKTQPDDARGVIIHELVHVVQAYPENREGWITEGIADYLRCAIFEAKPLADFPRPAKDAAFREGYKTAAGFLLWLESGPAPGVVRRLNAALRKGTYDGNTFSQATGSTPEELWKRYCQDMTQPSPLPGSPQRFRYGSQDGGAFERRPDGTWAEIQGGRVVWTFRETSRRPDAIELLDESRGMRLKLTANQAHWQRDGNWVLLYSGRWESAPGTPL